MNVERSRFALCGELGLAMGPHPLWLGRCSQQGIQYEPRFLLARHWGVADFVLGESSFLYCNQSRGCLEGSRFDFQ